MNISVVSVTISDILWKYPRSSILALSDLNLLALSSALLQHAISDAVQPRCVLLRLLPQLMPVSLTIASAGLQSWPQALCHQNMYSTPQFHPHHSPDHVAIHLSRAFITTCTGAGQASACKVADLAYITGLRFVLSCHLATSYLTKC